MLIYAYALFPYLTNPGSHIYFDDLPPLALFTLEVSCGLFFFFFYYLYISFISFFWGKSSLWAVGQILYLFFHLIHKITCENRDCLPHNTVCASLITMPYFASH